MRRGRSPSGEELNPYIALSDLVIGVALLFVLCVALGRLGMADVRYRQAQDTFVRVVQNRFADAGLAAQQPEHNERKNDPGGVQRWVIRSRDLFAPQTGSGPDRGHPQVSPAGEQILRTFSEALGETHRRNLWQRVRIEGHTPPPREGQPDDWELSCARAAVVARKLSQYGRIPPNFLAVAGRAGQNPAFKVFLFYLPGDRRVEAVGTALGRQGISYSLKDASAGTGQEDARRYGLERFPMLLVQDMDWIEKRIDPADAGAMAGLPRDFRENDRVEILVEYAGSGRAEAGSGP